MSLKHGLVETPTAMTCVSTSIQTAVHAQYLPGAQRYVMWGTVCTAIPYCSLKNCCIRVSFVRRGGGPLRPELQRNGCWKTVWIPQPARWNRTCVLYNFTKIGPMRAKSFIPRGQTDGTNMTKLAVAFRKSFVKEHKNGEFNNFKSLQHSYCSNLKIYKYLFSLLIILATLKWQGPGWITQPSDAREITVPFPEIFWRVNVLYFVGIGSQPQKTWRHREIGT